jgi:hypothetical protein
MQACLQRGESQMCLFRKVCILRTKFERYFQTLLSLISKGIVFKLYFYYFMQAKPFAKFIKPF